MEAVQLKLAKCKYAVFSMGKKKTKEKVGPSVDII